MHLIRFVAMDIRLILSGVVLMSMSIPTYVTPGQVFGQQLHVWFGTRGEQSEGIYVARFDVQHGTLTAPQLAARIAAPGFLAMNPQGTRLYSVCQIPDAPGGVAAFAIQPDTGALTPINTHSTGAVGPCHLSVTPDSASLLVACYAGSAIGVLPLAENGAILRLSQTVPHKGSSVHPNRQQEAHPHWIATDPTGQFAMVPDLGTDRVMIYQRDASRQLLNAVGAGVLPPGSGPRHLAFHPNGRWCYTSNELLLTVTGFRWDLATAKLEAIETVDALPLAQRKEDFTSMSEIRMHPSGRFLYAGLRGHDTIAVMAIDPSDGRLKLIENEPIRGSWPRNFAIDHTGRWLLAAGAESNTVSVFAIDPDSGRLTFTRNTINVPGPICVLFQRL
ncbi:MAG: lactonase family protein [Pirellulaceae bacterium]|nr:lactonase family protein [Planctomycetales bacterium]